MTYEWKYIAEFDSLPNANFIHCDTRSFHILIDNETIDYNPIKVCNVPESTLSLSLFSLEEILGWLKSLEDGSGGKGDWRFLSFNVGHKKAFDGWVKYIRLFKTDNGKYFAYTTYVGKVYPIHRDVHIPENIKQKALNFIKDLK